MIVMIIASVSLNTARDKEDKKVEVRRVPGKRRRRGGGQTCVGWNGDDEDK
jgi:hypothetical protein